MATTTNFGWTTPNDTDLVKDGAAAIRTALGGVDTSFVDLKGGTTGQVLSKASNTDLDYSWVAQDDSNAIQNAIVDAKGDLIAATAADTPARLAVGTNGQFLSADSTAATGLAWATPGGASGLTLITRNAFSNVASVTLDSIFSSTYKAYRIVIEDVYAATATNPLHMQLRYSTTTETGATYAGSSYGVERDGSVLVITNSDFVSQFTLSTGTGSNATDSNSSYSFTITKVGVSGNPSWNGTGFNGYSYRTVVIGGANSATRTYTGMVLKASASNITGTISVYGLGA